jgi:hypothetical protein
MGILFIPQAICEYGETQWNDIDGEKPKNSEKNLSYCYSVHHKSRVDWSRREPRPSKWEAGDYPSESFHGFLQILSHVARLIVGIINLYLKLENKCNRSNNLSLLFWTVIKIEKKTCSNPENKTLSWVFVTFRHTAARPLHSVNWMNTSRDSKLMTNVVIQHIYKPFEPSNCKALCIKFSSKLRKQIVYRNGFPDSSEGRLPSVRNPAG